MEMENAHSAINFKNTTHVNRNVFDQKNLGKCNFSNAHNLSMNIWMMLLELLL